MPIYEYECTQCHHQFDALQKVGDDPITECPECHKPSANRLVSAAGLQFKGTGWYATDYQKKPTPPTEQSTSTKASETTKSESKPASTTGKDT